MKKEKIKDQSIDKKQFILPILVSLVGFGLNIGGSITSEAFNLPFYFDTVGTIVIAYMGGYVPGIAVALGTNLFKCIEDTASIYYAPISIMIAIVTVYMYRSGRLNKIKHFIIYTFILSLISGVIGAILTMYLDEGAHYLFDNGVVVYYLRELADKAISVAFAGLILYLIPPKVRKRFELTLWLQNPFIDQKELQQGSKNKHYRRTLGQKINITVGVMSVAIAAICSVICMELFEQYMIGQHKEIGTALAGTAADFVDGDNVEKYLDEGDEFNSYKQTKDSLQKMLDNSNEIEYLYVYKILADGCHVVFDLDSGNVEASNLGDVISFDESFMEYVPDLLDGKEIEPVISNDKYGWLLTAYAPVYDSEGQCVCYAAVDISMNDLNDYKNDFFFRLITIFVGFWLLILAIGMLLSRYHLIYPINAISKVTDEFEYEDEYSRRRNTRNLSKINLRTGDELERLYRLFLEATEESTRYYEENEEKNEKINAMQSGLLMVLADVVENRDESTGSHVKKTAAYVEITVNKMKTLGYYKDELDDDFIASTIRSAPLHDIGKIAIPDAILNKPGRLTDEEFEIMKTHAQEGRKIIERAIETMPDAGYLEEARNLAGTHHEKWDGTGYPDGLREEEIPLSGRIMAVADVFDALVSRRAYKEPFPYEKAFDIIREGAGKHFDPLVADAFLKASEDVVIIADKFAQ